MKINAFYDREKKNEEIELESKATVKDLLNKMDINPVTVIVSRNDEVVLESEPLQDKDDVKILSVISGG